MKTNETKSSKQAEKKMRELEQVWKTMPGGDAARELVEESKAWEAAQRRAEETMSIARSAQREEQKARRRLAVAETKARAIYNVNKRTN